jgi:hypothetical protein
MSWTAIYLFGQSTRPCTRTLQQGLDGKAVPDAMLPPSLSVNDGCLQSLKIRTNGRHQPHVVFLETW